MSTCWWFVVIVASIYAVLIAWFLWQVYTAPLVDENFRVISDPHHRMRSVPPGSRRRRPGREQ